MAFVIRHGACSDIGRRRAQNEDRYLVDAARGLFVVCDGMGGGNAGEIASTLAIETIHAHLTGASAHPELDVIDIRDETVSTRTNRLAGAIRLANERIHRAAMEQSAWSGMGTTVVAAQVSEGLLSFAHVGDSRLYLIRDRTIQPLTSDHSWVAEQIRQGLLTEDEADRSPRRNIVTRAVGVEAAVDVAAGEVPLFPYDVLLLCTDGLTRGVSTSRILHHVMDTDDAQAVSQRLVALANDAGGEDNTTVVVLAVQDADEGLWLQLRRRLAI